MPILTSKGLANEIKKSIQNYSEKFTQEEREEIVRELEKADEKRYQYLKKIRRCGIISLEV